MMGVDEALLLVNGSRAPLQHDVSQTFKPGATQRRRALFGPASNKSFVGFCAAHVAPKLADQLGPTQESRTQKIKDRGMRGTITRPREPCAACSPHLYFVFAHQRVASFQTTPATDDVFPTTYLSTGSNRCLDAFNVALRQACEGGGKRWYGSTLELQLVSLEYCSACRSLPILHMIVDDGTPRSLWSPRKSDSGSDAHSYKIRVTRRVPVVHALRLTWNLSVEVLLQHAAGELWASLEFLQLRGSVSAASLRSVAWPRGLEMLVLDNHFEGAVGEVSWPVSLKRFEFGDEFNQPITGVAWPAPLRELSFGRTFDQPIAQVEWPASLEQLSFGHYFNQPVVGVVWPASLRRLLFGNRFNQPVTRGVMWPASLQVLSFGHCFNQPIAGAVWPAGLDLLTFGYRFNRPVFGVVWPISLQRLSFGSHFNQPINGVEWPASLEELAFGDSFDHPILGVTWPASLRKLFFGWSMNQPLAGVAWPDSLRQLSFGHSFNQPIAEVRWPAALQRLSFGSGFRQPVKKATWPASLRVVSRAGKKLL